jgi:hypothetical protein
MLHAILVSLLALNRQEFVRQFCGQRAGQRFTHRHDGNRIDNLEQLGDFIATAGSEFPRPAPDQSSHPAGSRGSIGHVHRQRQRLALLMAVDVQLDVGRQQALRRIPAGEIVARVTHQEGQLLIAPFIFQFHRRGEFAQQRRYRLEVDVIEDKVCSAGSHSARMHRVAALLQRDHLSFVIVQLNAERNMQRMFSSCSAVGGVRWLMVSVYCSVSGCSRHGR